MLKGIPALVFGSRRVPQPEGTRTTLIWDKGPALGMGALDLPWKPSHHEIYVIGKGFVGHRGNDVLTYPPVQSMARTGRVHPNEKPVPLMRELIAKCPLGTVFDPFMGSGSTGIAAIQEGFSFVGCEQQAEYIEIARRRIAKVLPKNGSPLSELQPQEQPAIRNAS